MGTTCCTARDEKNPDGTSAAPVNVKMPSKDEVSAKGKELYEKVPTKDEAQKKAKELYDQAKNIDTAALKEQSTKKAGEIYGAMSGFLKDKMAKKEQQPETVPEEN